MEKKEPVFEKRLGNIRVAIWENEANGATGKASQKWHNVSITRRYQVGEEWKEASTFAGLRDLALVSECIGIAKTWIGQRQEEIQASNAA